MSVEKNANATLSELLITRIQELIIENEEKKVDIRAESGITRGPLKGTKHYRPTEQASGRIKQLKRDLGALLTSSEEGRNALIAELDKVDLIKNPGKLGDTLAEYLKAKEGREVYFKIGRDSTVGHHATATNILRDALAGPLSYNKDKSIVKGQIANIRFDQKTRDELFEIAKKNKYNLGADTLAYIDPAAHKEFTTKLNGLLEKKFNIKTKEGLKQYINAQELLQRSAHARAFGGTSGIPLPPQLLTGKESAEQIFKISQPYLDLAKAGSIQGLNMHAVLKNTDWSNPEELLNVLRSEQLTGKIPNTDEILQRIYKSQVDNGIIPSGRLIGAFTDKNLLKKEHIPLWENQRKQIADLGPNAKWVDVAAIRNADLTDVLDKPIAIARGTKITPGSLGSDKFQGITIMHSVAGDGAAAITQPGLLSQAWRAVANADTGLTSLTKNIFDAEKAFSLTGGYNKLGKTIAKDFTWGSPFLLLDKDFRKKARKVDFTKPSTVLPVVEHGIKDYVIGEAVAHGVIKPLMKGAQYSWGLLPGAVQSVVTKGSAIGLAASIGGSEDEKIRWSRLGYESKEAYDAAMKKHEEEEGPYEKPKPFINSLFNRN